MKCKKKLISAAVSAALIVTSVFVPDGYCHAEESKFNVPGNSVVQGKYGETDYIYYKGNDSQDSFLIFEGTGKMLDIALTSQEENYGGGPSFCEKQGWFSASLDVTEEEYNQLAETSKCSVQSNVNDVIVGGNVTKVGNSVFFLQHKIKTVRLGKTVTEIGELAFTESSADNIYIYGDVTSIGSDAFADISSSRKIHVANDSVKALLKSQGGHRYPNSISVDLTVDDTPLRISLKKAAIEMNKYKDGAGVTAGSWKTLTDAVTAGQDYLDSEKTPEMTDEGVAEKAEAIDSAVKGLISSKELDDALESAGKLQESDYTAASWAKLQEAVTAGETGLEEATTAEQITQLATAITTAISELVKLTADVAKADLQTVLEKTADLVESDYTKKSWEALQTALSGAEEVADSDVISEITTATNNLQKAIDGLVVEYPIDWFALAGIPSGVWHSPIKSGTVDEEMEGATKVRITFDCASDTSYNPNATVVFSFGDDFKSFTGTDNSYTNGKKGFQETLELSAPLKAGDPYELTGETYAWKEASGDVFTIQAIEFLNDEDVVLKSVEAPAGVADMWTSAIEAAEEKLAELTEGDYTADSITEFKTYIESLKEQDAEKLLPSQINEVRTKLADVTTELTPSDNTAALTTLKGSIAEAEKLNQGDYTVITWNVLRKSLEAAKKADETTVISEVQALNQALLEAIEGLVKTTTNPTQDPNKSPDPNETPDPNKSPDPKETPDPNETTNPSTKPDSTTTPDPSNSPDPNETTNPSTKPDPTKEPDTQATKAPVPTQKPGGSGTGQTNVPPTAGAPAKTGTKITSGNLVYQVTKEATAQKAGALTVVTLSKAGKKASKLSIPATATLGGYKYSVTKLGNNALKGAKAKAVTLGKNITAIPKGAFASCKKLSTLTIKAKLKSVKKGAFKGCKKKIKVKCSKKNKKAIIKLLKKSGYKKFK